MGRWVEDLLLFFIFGDHLKNHAKTTRGPGFLLFDSLVFLDNYDCPGSLLEKYGNFKNRPIFMP